MLPPIKLLKNKRLCRFVGDTYELDKNDTLELKVLNRDPQSINLLAIENASEIAKIYLQRNYENILKLIRKESLLNEKNILKCKNFDNLCFTNSLYDVEYIHLEKNLSSGGHAIFIKVEHHKKRIHVYDSMDNFDYEFRENMMETFKHYAIKDHSVRVQPTGGFIQTCIDDFKWCMSIKGNPKYLKNSFEISQCDELSQHHFCYVESFLVMACQHLRLYPYKVKDPRKRLIFIKKIIWGILHKLYKNNDDDVWNYFLQNFPYVMETYYSNGDKVHMNNDTFHAPKRDFITKIEKIDFPEGISDWTLHKIIKWANATTF